MYFWWYWGLKSGCSLARQVVYHLGHTHSLLFTLFYGVGLVLSLPPGLALGHNLCIFYSWDYRYVSLCWLLCLDGDSLTFYQLVWPGHTTLPISACQVAGITGMRHCVQPYPTFFYSFTHTCIHCLGHFYPLLADSSLFPLLHLLPGRICSALISNFVEEKHRQ
jgi:hypothetical protein